MKLLLLIGILVLTGCGQTQSQPQASTITEADARQIALDKAGLENATFTKQEYDATESNFDFEFHTDTKEYECEVNALNGEIKDYSVEERYERMD